MIAAPMAADAAQMISKPRRRTQDDFVESVVRAALSGGIKDLSMQELKSLLARHHDTAMDLSVISRVVNALVTAGRLVRDADNKRACTVSGHLIRPISMPKVQARMFA